jgi:hypothetical protein
VPLVNHLAEKHGKILLPVQRHCYNTIRSFYDNDKVDLVVINSWEDYAKWDKEYEVIAFDVVLNSETKEVYAVYEAAGLNFHDFDNDKTLINKAKNVTQKVVSGLPYAFVPEGGSTRTFKIDRKYITPGLHIVQPEHNDFMPAYANIIKNATEIHCHATGWQRLIERLETTGKLFMHHYARPTATPEYFPHIKEWTPLL